MVMKIYRDTQNAVKQIPSQVHEKRISNFAKNRRHFLNSLILFELHIISCLPGPMQSAQRYHNAWKREKYK